MELCAKEGDTIEVGSDLFKLDTDVSASASEPSAPATPQPKVAGDQMRGDPIIPKIIKEEQPKQPPQPITSKSDNPSKSQPSIDVAKERSESREKLTRMRMRIAERMKEAQNTAASLTTFNEADMSQIMAIRSKHKDAFFKEHGVKLGYMSMFLRACTIALQEIPVVNARLDTATNELVFPDFVDISVAVATPKVPSVLLYLHYRDW